jgi:cell division septation protein DedD
VTVGAFSSRGTANSVVGQLKAKGVAAYAKEAY